MPESSSHFTTCERKMNDKWIFHSIINIIIHLSYRQIFTSCRALWRVSCAMTWTTNFTCSQLERRMNPHTRRRTRTKFTRITRTSHSFISWKYHHPLRHSIYLSSRLSTLPCRLRSLISTWNCWKRSEILKWNIFPVITTRCKFDDHKLIIQKFRIKFHWNVENFREPMKFFRLFHFLGRHWQLLYLRKSHKKFSLGISHKLNWIALILGASDNYKK